MNKKAQGKEIGIVISGLVSIIILVSFLQVIGSLFNQNCPACDCSTYQNKLVVCENQTKEIIYINKTIGVPVERVIEKTVYKDKAISITIISFSLAISLSLTILSFKINLPKKLEEELERIENIIKYFKFGSLILTFLIFIKLLSILLSIID